MGAPRRNLRELGTQAGTGGEAGWDGRKTEQGGGLGLISRKPRAVISTKELSPPRGNGTLLSSPCLEGV